jgi:hypothetical protein
MTLAADGTLGIAKLDGSELITARAIEDRLAVTRISLPVDDGRTDGLVLAFGKDAGFGLSIEGQVDVVSGRARIAEGPDGSIISLTPLQPGWAVNRTVRVACSTDGDQMRFVTTIGSVLEAGS